MELTIEQALQQGVAAHNAGNLQEAERAYQAILQSQPKHPDANHNLGLIAISVNQIEAALPLFKTALDVNPNVEQFWMSYIDALFKNNQVKDAKRAIKKATKKGVDAKKLQALRSQSKGVTDNKVPSQELLNSLLEHYQNGRLSEAEKLAVSIAQEFPKHQFAWKVLGAIFGQSGRTVEAENASQTSVALSPQDAEAHSNLGITLQELGRLDEAEASYKQATALKPDYAEAHSNLGNTLRELGRLDEAEASYKQAVELKPDYAEAHSNLGITLQELGRLEQAEASYKQAIALKPDYAEAHYNLGITLQELGRLDEAEASYKHATALKPDYAEAHSNLGNTLRELGRLDEAEASYKQAIALKPDYTEVHYNLGITLQELGRLDEAEASYKQAIELKPDYIEAHYNLGITLQELGRLDEAEASYKQAIALQPDYAEAHSNLGITLQELGRLDEAEASYKQAIALKPDYAEAHSNLGNTLRELGRLDEAEVSYKQAIELKPDYAEAHSNLGVLWFESKQYNLAAEKFELSNLKNSKLYRIKCSFLQDEETIFYEKFDLLVNQGEINAVMGSLAFSSEFKYGIKKSNPFCSDPLSYVVKTHLNELYDFKNIFIETANDILTDNSVSYKAQGHLTNGVQTAGNIFEQGKVLKTEIENIIHTEIEKYQIQFKDSEEGFIKNWPTYYEIKGWLVCMQSGGKLAPHMHDTGWVTGSIYINVPPKSTTDCGNLVLCLSDQEHVLAVEKNQKSIIDVVTGTLCLFPSSLHHYTVPFEEKEDRIVLAFDVIPRDKAINR
jgi:tetratricopeptide (TPR) repeat protein